MVGAQRPFWCRLGILAAAAALWSAASPADVIADIFVLPLDGLTDDYLIGAATKVGSTPIVVYSETHVVVRAFSFVTLNCPFRFKPGRATPWKGVGP
jgi:hypothetical protein